MAERLGFGAKEVLDRYPGIVYVDATGYGLEGPYAHRPAYATSIAAAGGQTMRNAGGRIPDMPNHSLDDRREVGRRLAACTASPSANADSMSGLGVATAILLGLVGQAGRGVHLETTMLSNSAHVVYDDVGLYPEGISLDVDPDLFGCGSLYRLYRAAAGWVFLAAPSAREWLLLVDALGEYVNLGADERFSNEESRRRHDSALASVLAEVFAKRAAEDWERELTARDIACVVSATKTPESILMGEVGRASEYVTEVVHPTFDQHPRLTPALRFSRSQTVAQSACLMGEHTKNCSLRLGMTIGRLSDFMKRTSFDE